jgi:Cu/Ag efflux pump CusA
MLRQIVALVLARRPLVLISFSIFIGLGLAAFATLNIEAYPDPAPPYIRRDINAGIGSDTAIIRAAETRMRQILMTGLSACIGLVPAAISTGIGAQVQQPLVCVIVGGMLPSPICSLLVIPTFARFVMPKVAETDAGRTWATEHH